MVDKHQQFLIDYRIHYTRTYNTSSSSSSFFPPHVTASLIVNWIIHWSICTVQSFISPTFLINSDQNKLKSYWMSVFCLLKNKLDDGRTTKSSVWLVSIILLFFFFLWMDKSKLFTAILIGHVLTFKHGIIIIIIIIGIPDKQTYGVN